MLASVDKKGATLSDILRADGYGLGGASEQAVEQAIEGLALGAETVQGCALGILYKARRACSAGLGCKNKDPSLACREPSTALALERNEQNEGACKQLGASFAQQNNASTAC